MLIKGDRREGKEEKTMKKINKNHKDTRVSIAVKRRITEASRTCQLF